MVRWSEEDGEWVATTARYPSLSWLSPDPVDALSNLISLVHHAERDEEQGWA